MKVPEFLFVVINPVMKLLLHSPLHFILSGSIMLITFTGRKSGKRFTTPVRYLRQDGVVRCFTAAENQWWRNLRNEADVELRIAGKNGQFKAQAIVDNPVEVKQKLVHYLGMFPQDAAYHEVRLNKDGTLFAEDLEQAVQHAIVVEARPV